MAPVLGVSLEWLATGKGQAPARSPSETAFMAADQVLVPIYPVEIGAGAPRLSLPAGLEPRGYYPVTIASARQYSPQPSALVALRVQGHSMEPTIPHGEIAIIDTTRTVIRPRGGIYALRIEDGLVIKRVRWQEDRLVLSSDNPDFPPQIIDPPEAERVQVLGFVPAWFPPEAPTGRQA